MLLKYPKFKTDAAKKFRQVNYQQKKMEQEDKDTRAAVKAERVIKKATAKKNIRK